MAYFGRAKQNFVYEKIVYLKFYEEFLVNQVQSGGFAALCRRDII